jgi:small-conductance mechanosensitive channel
VAHLQKATQAATDNEVSAQGTFSRIIKQHQDKLQEWREETAKQEQRLKALENQGGLTFEQIKLRGQIRSFLDEYRNAITQSERSLTEINSLLALLKKERDTYAASLAEWRGFIAKEHSDITQSGSPAAYVADKLDQIKADDARPRLERLAYGRRLLRLDPTNGDVTHFINGLLGKDEQPVPALPRTRKSKKS